MIQIPESIQDLISLFSFRGNSSLRQAGAVIEYTPDMISEYIKCSQDPIYFIENYVKVTHVDRGEVLMKLYDYQKEMIKAYHRERRCLSMLFRQAGKTATTAAFITWYIIFNDTKTVLVLANKAVLSREILHRVKFAYESLPKWMQQGVVSWNKGSIELENGSRVIAQATSPSAGRGFSVSLLYCDEFGHLENNIAEEFFTSVYPTISSGKETKILISSTPNGFNLFKKFWDDSLKPKDRGWNGFFSQRFDWWEHPDRDQTWADEQLAALGEVKYNQEVLMTFNGSSLTLLSGSTLSRLTHDIPIKEYIDQYKGLSVYKLPEKDRIYSISVDVSRGRHLDNSAFIVFDITSYPHTIAATYKNNEIPPLLYASLIEKIGNSYNTAHLLIEINDIGAQVADTLWNDLEYPEMFWTKSGDQVGKTGADPYPGVRTTKKTKRIGCANLADMINNNQMIVNDYNFIHELSTFVQSKTGSYEADENFHDDLVMCGVLHSWLVTQPHFTDLTDSNARDAMHLNHMQELEDQICMQGFVSDGNEAYEEINSSHWH